MGALTPRRLARASNPRTNYLLLASYLWHPLPWVSRAAAVNPATPQWARRWANARAPLLDIALASKDTPQDFLARHVANPLLSSGLVLIIASNPRADPQTLEAALRHPNAVSPSVPYAILANPAADLTLVGKILEEARNQFEEHPSPALSVFEAALKRADMPQNVLTWLAHNCTVERLLAEVATHPNTPEADAVFAALRSRQTPTSQP